MAIPKNIHAIWWQGVDKISPKHLANLQSIATKNPTWTFFRWDEKSIRPLIEYLGPQYVKKLDEFKLLHQKVDYSRSLLLWLFGGVSVDTDVVAIKGFDETPGLDKEDLIVSWNSSSKLENIVKGNPPKTLNNATILASKNNPIIKSWIDHLLTVEPCKEDESKYSCINNTTGPKEFTNYLLKNHKDKIKILDHSFFEPCQGNDAACEIQPTTILDHQHEGSWVGDENKKISEAYYSVKPYAGIIMLLLIIVVLAFLLPRMKI